MDNTYDLFSTYYRELIYASGHFEKEKRIVTEIAEKFSKGNYYCNILDAACGTGDALLELFKQGFMHLTGLDGSFKMIERAKELLPEFNFYHIKWEDLSKIQFLEKTYDLIFLISMSLPHAQREVIPTIIQSFYNMLSPGGTLVFDNRKWITDENNFLIEANRPKGIYDNRKRITIDNQEIIIDDKCEYLNDRQKITYRIRIKDCKKTGLLLSVDYTKLLSNEYLEILSSIGFQTCHSYFTKEWPYEIIYAIK